MYLSSGLLSRNDLKLQKESVLSLAKNTIDVSLPKFHVNANRSLYIFSEDNFLRNAAKYIITFRLFEVLIQLTIFANCVVLALESHLPDGDTYLLDKSLQKAELFFIIIFTIEAVLKIIVNGFILGRNTYLRNPWNILDFVVISVGIVGSMFRGFDQRVIGALRSLRPLKLIYNIKSLQIVMQSLLRAMQPMLQIAILILFIIVMFSIIGLEFYSGKFHFACFKNEGRNLNDNNLPSKEQVCSSDNSSSNAFFCPMGTICRMYWAGPYYGTINYDNILFSMLTVFQCVTMEGWTDIMYTTNEATGTPWNYFYYVSVVIIGSFCLLNLILGVLSGEFAKERERVEKRQMFIKQRQEMILNEEVDGYLDWIATGEDMDWNLDYVESQEKKELYWATKSRGEIGNTQRYSDNIDDETSVLQRKVVYDDSGSACFHCCNIVTLLKMKTRRLLKSQPFFWSVIILVTLNIIIVSTEYYKQPKWLNEFQSASEYVFLGIFAFEMFMKMFALGVNSYFHSIFNCFDFVIVIASTFEVVWQCIRAHSSFGISAVRTIRILRLFKVTRYWSSMRLLVLSLLNSLRSVFSLLLLMYLFLFISAILGMQLFGGNYTFVEGRPTQNFDTFLQAMLTVFQILTGENWNEAMYNGIRSQMTKASSYHMVYSIYFVLLVIFGNYTLLNIFLAIAVDNLGNLMEAEQDDRALDENEDLSKLFGKRIEIPPLLILPTESPPTRKDDQFRFKTIAEELEATFHSSIKPSEKSSTLSKPLNPYSSLYFFGPTNWIRKVIHFIINVEHFETFITLMIVANSVSLAAENVVNDQAPINKYLEYVDSAFAVAFTIECFLKIIDMGLILHPESYFRSIWNIIDISVVITTILYFTLDTKRSTMKSLRVVRVLRPLKTIQRIKKLRNVFETVIQSIKNVFSILILYWLFQYIFAVIAVQIFGGRFFYCNDYSKRTFEACQGFYFDYKGNQVVVVTKRVWQRFCFHYDDVVNAMITLFTVTTSEGWLNVLRHSMDSTDINMGPIFNYRAETALFYVIFFVIFPFFFVNIFVALIIITFQEEGQQSFLNHGLNKNQKFCIDFAVTSQPRARYVPTNKDSIRFKIWSLVESTPFEIFILTMIALNTLVLIMRYFRRENDASSVMTEDRLNSIMQYNLYHAALNYLYFAFIALFSLECILKMYAFNPKNYFADFWNVFDFITVIGSITDALLTNITMEGVVKYAPNIGILRLFRAARLTKLLAHIFGIRIIMWTFVQSFKSLPYVILLIFIIFFIYAIIGMQLFGNIKVQVDTPIQIYNNFQTLSSSMLLLFRCATGENWQDIMIACDTGQQCEYCIGPDCASVTCGSSFSYLYFISFSFLTTFLMLNLFIAVLMENFDYLTRDVSVLGPHHLDQYVKKWSHYDPLATGEIHYTDVYELLMRIEPPVGFGHKCPYRVAYSKLIRMNMPVKDGKVHFKTTLMALIREALAIKKGHPELSDVLDMELRGCISAIWPDVSEESLHLLVPSDKDLSYPHLTIGKIYTCLWIYENWQTYKAAMVGRRRPVRSRSRIDSNSASSLRSRADLRYTNITQYPETSAMSITDIQQTSLDKSLRSEQSTDRQEEETMYQRLEHYIDQKLQKKDENEGEPEVATGPALHRSQSRDSNSEVSDHWTAIVTDLCHTYKLNIMPKGN